MELTARFARAQKIAVLFTEHDMDVVFSQADRLIVLDRGRLIAAACPPRCAPTPRSRRSIWGAGIDVLLFGTVGPPGPQVMMPPGGRGQ